MITKAALMRSAWPAALVALGGLTACERQQSPPRPVSGAVGAEASPSSRADPVVSTVPSTVQPGAGEGAAAPAAAGTDMGRPLLGHVDPPPAVTTSPETTLANAPPAAGIPVPPPASMASALTATELAFVTQAIEAGLFDLRVGQLGVERASHTAVRSYAALLVNDQTAMNRNLQQLARRLGVPAPTSLSEPRQRILDDLARASDAEFDRQFVHVAGARAQQDTVALFERTGRDTRDQQVRSFVLLALPTLRAHLSAAERLPVRG